MKIIIKQIGAAFFLSALLIVLLELVRWQYSALLFHTLAEFIAIVIALLMAVVAGWHFI